MTTIDRLASRGPRDPGHDRPQARLRDLADPRPRLRGGGRATRSRSATGTSTPRRPTRTRPRSARGSRDGGVPRNELFLTTKLWRERVRSPTACGRRPRSRCEQLQVGLPSTSCCCTGPTTTSRSSETLGALAALREEGLDPALRRLELPRRACCARRSSIAPIFADQVEFHPFLGQDAPASSSRREKDFMVTAYSPLARGKVPEDETLREIGEAHGKTAGQVALRWLLDKPNVATDPEGLEPRAAGRELRGLRLRAQRRRPSADRGAARRTSAMIDPRLGAGLGRLIRRCPACHRRSLGRIARNSPSSAA